MNSFENLDWTKITENLKSYATSHLAQGQIEKLSVKKSTNEALQSFSEIHEAAEIIEGGMRPFMESLDLFSTWSTRLQKRATLKTLELKDIRHLCIEALSLKETLDNHKHLNISVAQESIEEMDRALSAIDQVISPHGEIKTDASELLYKLTKEKGDQTKRIQKLLNRVVKDNDMDPMLQDRYVTNREGRWVIPVKSGMQHEFGGIIHASSQSKQTVFMEPEVVIPVNNRLREIENEIQDEIGRLLKELSEFLYSLKEEVFTSKETLLTFDILFAKAKLSYKLKAKPCSFDDSSIDLKQVRHPVLVLQNEGVIENDVLLDRDNKILLLSGPNAGGKTVLLKAIGLAVQMARCGLPICAEEESSLPFFEDIHIAIGDFQSVDENLSTFAAHLKVLNHAAQSKGNKQLLLIDEICGSTDPEEGTALARSFICEYAKNDVFAIITSHLGGLKKGWNEGSGVINGSLEFSKTTGPTYKFLLGVPGQSLAIQTAERVGVDAHIVKEATNFLSPEHRDYIDGLKEVEKVKAQLNKLQEESLQSKKKAEKVRSEYEAQLLKLEAEKDKILAKAQKSAERKIDDLISHAKVEQTFKKHENLHRIKAEMPEVIKPSAQKKSITSAEDFAKKFPPGSKAFSASLNQDVVVQGEPNSKGEVPILSRSMRLLVSWKDLTPPNHMKNPNQEILRKSKHYAVLPAEGDRTVDLRGMTSEDAIGELEIQLDTASLNGEDRVKIIHGHGTDTLKKATRSHLSRSLYVKKWSAGNSDTGGDGITWVELKD